MFAKYPRRASASRGPAALISLALMLAVLVSCVPSPQGAAIVSPTAPATAPAATATRAIATRTARLSPPTRTPSPTRTPQPTASSTATPSRTPTRTPTATNSPSPTVVPTQPVAAAPTLLPTQTVTATLRPTITPTPAQSPTPLPAAAFGEDVVNILLIGLDSTTNLRGQNTDVIMVVSVNKKTGHVSMLSIPRDLWVYIPTYGWNRINTAHRRGYSSGYPGEGPALLIRTLEMNLGVTAQHWARVDFKGFERVVDELGGIDMTVACPVNLRYKAPTSPTEEEMVLQPGVYHMDGALALRYVRTRRGGSDFDRARRQQQFLKAMWNQFKSPDFILKIPGLWSALKSSVVTDLKLGDLISMARVGIGIKPQRIHSYYIGPNETDDWTTSDGWMVLLPKQDKLQQVVARFAAPPTQTTADQAADEAAVIHVLNGTTRAKLETFAADQLQWYGLKAASTGAADRTDYKVTQIVVFDDHPKAVELLASVFKVKPANILYQPNPSQSADVQVILGADYDPCK